MSPLDVPVWTTRAVGALKDGRGLDTGLALVLALAAGLFCYSWLLPRIWR
jgi:hypothetical protein